MCYVFCINCVMRLQDPISGSYDYSYSDLRPWDPRTDLFQYECDYIIATKTRHKHLHEGRPGPVGSQATSLTASLISMDHAKEGARGERLRGVKEGEETSSGAGEEEQMDTVATTPVLGAMASTTCDNVAIRWENN